MADRVANSAATESLELTVLKAISKIARARAACEGFENRWDEVHARTVETCCARGLKGTNQSAE
jgi:hypothetical protein